MKSRLKRLQGSLQVVAVAARPNRLSILAAFCIDLDVDALVDPMSQVPVLFWRDQLQFGKEIHPHASCKEKIRIPGQNDAVRRGVSWVTGLPHRRALHTQTYESCLTFK